ncbi:MAG: PadR family transcriptional regulator [Planctomycetes bacterium]|nr:PadR family transcriptional regulator [Planctomycetota bacterium]
MPNKNPTEPGQRWIIQMRKGLLELCILAVLQREDGYGYLIVQRLKQVPDLTMNEGTVYPILQRLHREGCLSTYRLPSENGPPRRWFRLTDFGRVRLLEMTQRWQRMHQGVDLLVQAGLPQNPEKQ